MPSVKRKNRSAPKATPPAAESAPPASSSAPSPVARVGALPALEAARAAESQAAALAPTAPLSAIDDTADRLHSAAIHLLRRLRIRDRESGIGPAQLSALSVLVFGGPTSLGELADAEQVRPPTMSRIVAGLQRSRLIRRQATKDGRRIRLTATARGTKILWEGRRRRVEMLAKAVASLSENERLQLRNAITLLQQVIRVL